MLLASLIGDWQAVEEAAKTQGQSEVAARAAVLASQSSRRWLNVVRVSADRELDDDALHVLAAAKAEDLGSYVAVALSGSNCINTAIEIIRDYPDWFATVQEVYGKSFHDKRFRYSRMPAAFYLAKHGHPVEALIRGLMTEPHGIADAIALAVSTMLRNACRLLRKGLRSRDYYDRFAAAAVLALLDNEWSQQENADHPQAVNKPRRHDRVPLCAARMS